MIKMTSPADLAIYSHPKKIVQGRPEISSA